MKKKFFPFSVFLIFIIIFIFFYKGLNEINIYYPNKNLENDLPVFKTRFLYSTKELHSTDIFEFDKIYLLNIWSSWCVPCRQEHSLLMGLKKEGQINIIGMNYKDTKKNAENFLLELGNPYEKILIDLDGTKAIELGAYGVPESFLIHKNKIIKKYIGPLNQKLIDEMRKILE